MNVEIWKKIEDFPAYDVSDTGQVRSYHARARGRGMYIADMPQRILAPLLDKDGYHRVHLCAGGQVFTRQVALLVAGAFIGPRPDSLQVCHNNGKNDDNRPQNLRYDAPKGNTADIPLENRLKWGRPQLTDEQVIEIRERYCGAIALCHADLADEYEVSPSIVARVCSGATYSRLAGPITRRRYGSGKHKWLASR